MEKILKIKPPILPNFYFYEQPPGKREDGFKPDVSHPITDFNREEAEEFGELMKQAFIKHWEDKKANQ